MKHRIAICTEYPLLDSGGVEILVRALIWGLKDSYEIVLVSADSDKEALGEYSQWIVSHFQWAQKKASATAAQKLAGKLRNQGVELVHFHGGGVYGWNSRLWWQSAIIACADLGMICLTTLHLVPGLLEGYCGPLKPVWFKLALFPGAWISRLQVLLKNRVEIAVSNENKEAMQRRFFPLRRRFMRIYHSAIVPEEELPLKLEDREAIVLNVATITQRKGQLELARAFAMIAARYPQWKLAFIGRSPDRAYDAKIRDVVKASGLESRVLWIGSQTPAQVMHWMARSAVFALPSFSEGLPLSLQEALYRGCAAVGSMANGIPELIEHERNGLLVPVGSITKLANALDRLLDDPGLRHRLASAARESIIAKKMTHKQMIENYRLLYESNLERF